MSTYSDERIEKAIPGTIYMFAGADDTQQACDVSNVKGFQLPDPAGKSGGACTSALLQTLWRDEDDDDIRYSWADTLEMMRTKIEEIGLTQVPQLSASRPIDVNEEIMISNPMGTRGDEYDDDEDDEADDSGRRNRGVKRALLVGVNYTGEANALTSCHNDVRNMKDFLMQVHGFERENMLIMMVSATYRMTIYMLCYMNFSFVRDFCLMSHIFLLLLFHIFHVSLFRMIESTMNPQSSLFWMHYNGFVRSVNQVIPSFSNSQVRSLASELPHMIAGTQGASGEEL